MLALESAQVGAVVVSLILLPPKLFEPPKALEPLVYTTPKALSSRPTCTAGVLKVRRHCSLAKRVCEWPQSTASQRLKT